METINVLVKLTLKGVSNGTRYALYYLTPGQSEIDKTLITGKDNVPVNDLMQGVVCEVPNTADRILILDVGFGSNDPICEGLGTGYIIIAIDMSNCNI